LGGVKLIPILLNEIPIAILDLVGEVKNLTYPRQGHTSDVCIIESNKGFFVLKRTKGERYCSWLSQEVFVFNSLSQTDLPTHKIYQFIEEKDKSQSWVLLEYIEGETLRNSLMNENNKNKRQEMIFHFRKNFITNSCNTMPPELVKNSLWLENMLKQAEINLHQNKVDGTMELLKKTKREQAERNKTNIDPWGFYNRQCFGS
jgi:hypothetical protein